MKFEQITYRPGPVTRIIFNRPEYLNAQGYQLLDEVDRAFATAVADNDCGAIVLSGAGRSFSAGHDLGTPEELEYCERIGLAKPYDQDLRKKVIDMNEYFVKKTLVWRNCPKPTVAMVHGYCIYAGWMLAAAMDVIFASEDALFLPGMVEYFSAPWDLGPRKAKEILLEHRFITASEALSYGFVNRTYQPDRLEDETLSYAKRIADNYLAAPSWIETIKSSINHMQDAMGFSSEIEAAYNNFCLMLGLGAHTSAGPSAGGFARTDVAKRNLSASKPWLFSRGLATSENSDK
ncbi:MAG: enoyl-CoA hydratase-related protein [Syntrophales bacterium]|jgi:enoyl-CoA hydratase|nr:enoyl-CoA hydratase-related protein [Syntrophales bacterium]